LNSTLLFSKMGIPFTGLAGAGSVEG